MEPLDLITSETNVDADDLEHLRRALRLLDRKKSRKIAQKKLEKIANRRDPWLSPVAQAGLASSALWDCDYRAALYWLQQTLGLYPMSAAAVFSATLLTTVYRTLGMKRERFQAEQERFRLLRKIAFHSEETRDRIYALTELLKELRARDLADDAERCAEELKDLIRSLPSEQQAQTYL